MIDNNSIVYISGAISNDSDYIEKFYKCEKMLIDRYGCKVYNPVRETQKEFKEPEKIVWSTLMLFVLADLTSCTHIYMLDDWQESSGAKIEWIWAIKNNIEVIYES